MPPRGPTSSPQPRASASCGRMPAENTTTSVSTDSPSAKRSTCWCTRPPRWRGRLAAVHAHAQRFDVPSQHATAALIELHGHQARRELDHVRFQTQVDQRLGGFQAQQAAADHHAAPGSSARRADGDQILDGAIDEAVAAVAARNGRHERIRTRGQHQPVVGDHITGAGRELPAAPVDRDGALAQPQSRCRAPRRTPRVPATALRPSCR